jgi:hypothetical protein
MAVPRIVVILALACSAMTRFRKLRLGDADLHKSRSESSNNEVPSYPTLLEARDPSDALDGHASISTKQGGNSPKCSNTFARQTRLRITTAPATSTPQYPDQSW